jgi:hypothetical protein
MSILFQAPSILDSDQNIHSLDNIPSPVSILDTSFYHKRILDSFKGEKLFS